MDYSEKSLLEHKNHKGKLEVRSKLPLENIDDLSIAYTPGVAAVSKAIAQDTKLARELTFKGNSVAVISDGSAVLGLGNIGPEAALPVMEGKAILFKEFAGIDAIPVVLDTQDTEEIIKTIKVIAPTFSGINLEDISAPRCFEIEERLKQELKIPVFHDDQHGTAIVVLAGLINALKVVNKQMSEIKVVINGVGAAGTSIARLLQLSGVQKIIAVDSKGIINNKRADLNEAKLKLLDLLDGEYADGSLADAIIKADVFIGVSIAGALSKQMVTSMNTDPIIFAMANPVPEIMPAEAKQAGARIIATGRSDFPNQVNNVLAFPGVFRGAIDNRVEQITDEMKLAAAKAIAEIVQKPTADQIIPSAFDKNVAKAVAASIK